MKKVFILFVIILIIVSTTAFVVHYGLFGETETKKFYVGVTYCGESVEEAKLLIDRVKNYSNLFVLQSGELQEYPEEINTICDYAVSSGMYFMVYFSNNKQGALESWLETCEDWWGDQFLGVYYSDEPGGRMLESITSFSGNNGGASIIKGLDGIIRVHTFNRTLVYFPDGHIQQTISPFNTDGDIWTISTLSVSYYPNGTISGHILTDRGMIDLEDIDNDYQLDSYENLSQANPFQNYDKTAETFVDYYQNSLSIFDNRSIMTLTSDYVLHWFGYKAGYDVILAQFGWNHTLAQDIALVRGAARLQNKPWGTIITWKYNNPPYLDSGEAIYDQMRMSYECGAEYVVIFNYARDMEGPYGTLQDEHFTALERFWNEVVQSPTVKQGSIEAEAVLVLPENYGWGMRDREDKIWGLWGPDEKSQQIWELSRNLLDQYGLGLDIVYDDPEFPVAGNYPQIRYWNHTG